MNSILRFFLLYSLIIICEYPAQSSILIYKNKKDIIKINKELSILEDKNDTLQFAEVLHSNYFKLNDDKIPNLGISNSSYWIKFTIKNLSDETRLFIELKQPRLTLVEFYVTHNKGEYNKQIINKTFSFEHRKFSVPSYLFDFTIQKDEIKTCYLKVRSNSPIILPIVVGTSIPIFESFQKKDVMVGFYSGLIFIMIIFNLFIFYRVQEMSYLYYILFIFFTGLAQVSLHGYPFKYLWPDLPWLELNAMNLFLPLSGITAIKFFQAFLKTNEHTPKLDKILSLFYIAYIIGILLTIFQLQHLSFKVSNLSSMLLSIYVMYTSYIISRKGFRPAKFYFVAYSIFICGIIIFVLKDFGLLPYNDFTFNTMILGSGIEVTLLSFALADRMYNLKKENENKQVEIIRHLRDNEQYLKASQELALNAEKLKKEVLASEFESLKNQVNPHFLFNSLNVLTELVYQNQDQATKFIKELSEVYRYVLDNKNKEVVELKTEYEFIRAFIFLLKIRFDKNLNVNIELPLNSKIMIAPLTLQLLIENAIKHNIISEDEPLTIDIFLKDKYIIVNNNIQRKNVRENSTRLGLKNIISRYEFLSNQKVSIIDEEKFFIVKIPILYF